MSEKRSQGRYIITIQITYLGGELPSALLLSLSPLSSYLGLAARSLSSYERLSSRSIQASRARTTGSGNARPISIASSTDANGFHARTWLPARRPIPLPVCARLPPELGFRRRYAIFVMCRVVARASR